MKVHHFVTANSCEGNLVYRSYLLMEMKGNSLAAASFVQYSQEAMVALKGAVGQTAAFAWFPRAALLRGPGGSRGTI